MSYSVYVEHPESIYRREQDFPAWTMWAAKHAPWSGAGTDEMAYMIDRLLPDNAPIRGVLDQGGVLTAQQARTVLRAAEDVMAPPVATAFHAAVDSGHGLRVVYTPEAFGGLNASAWLAKFGSDSEA